jgi:tetratricopeptide (TPR) repeat protein
MAAIMKSPMLRAAFAFLLFILFSFAQLSFAQQQTQPKAYPPGSPQDLVQQGTRLNFAGKQDEAIALYKQALEQAPELYEAHLEMGIALDLKGEYAEARKHLTKAIDLTTSETRAQALRTTAFSYAFEGKAGKAAPYEKQLFDNRIENADWIRAAEICNELARIYLESGDTNQAYKWYKLGYDTADRKPDLTDADKNLWLFRWESAQARIAARRGNAAEAQQHVAAAKAALDKANNPDQMRFYPYLTGYVAYYIGDYKTAITEFQKADQHDPLNLAMLGEAYEKSGDKASAQEYYRKVLEINIHNPTNAFARPLAKKKLGL